MTRQDILVTAMPLQHDLLRQLCDGRFHSGEALARQFGVTRTAIWKACKAITRNFDLRIDAVNGRGYRLPEAVELLDKSAIESAMQTSQENIDVHTLLSVDSTNRHVMDLAAQGEASGTAVFAEYQRAGRGRRGRTWVSPFGGNLYFSLLWRFTQPVADLPGLGLAVGVALVRVLRKLGISGLELKWPNDVLCQRRKLAGVLIELQGEMSGPYAVVIGIGLNVRMSSTAKQEIDQSWIDLATAGEVAVSRNQLAALLLDETVAVLQVFTEQGLAPFVDEWRECDRFRDQDVELHLADQVIRGIARGIDEHGALLLEQQQQLKRYYSGDMRLRGMEV